MLMLSQVYYCFNDLKMTPADTSSFSAAEHVLWITINQTQGICFFIYSHCLDPQSYTGAPSIHRLIEGMNSGIK